MCETHASDFYSSRTFVKYAEQVSEEQQAAGREQTLMKLMSSLFCSDCAAVVFHVVSAAPRPDIKNVTDPNVVMLSSSERSESFCGNVANEVSA